MIYLRLLSRIVRVVWNGNVVIRHRTVGECLSLVGWTNNGERGPACVPYLLRQLFQTVRATRDKYDMGARRSQP
jgi:hypothetical protein